MPTVAVVEGVKIQIFAEEHPPPHFHAQSAEHRVRIEISSLRVLNGRAIDCAKVGGIET
jgi:Domain of unknown function (DUF4160)